MMGGHLITPTGYLYSALILPPMELCDRAAAALQRLADQGLLILSPQSGTFPAISEHKFATVTQNEAELFEKLPTHIFSCYAEKPIHGVVCQSKTAVGGKKYLFVNAEESAQTVHVTLRGRIIHDPVLYDPFTQQILPATFEVLEEKVPGQKATFTLAPLQTAIVISKDRI